MSLIMGGHFDGSQNAGDSENQSVGSSAERKNFQ